MLRMLEGTAIVKVCLLIVLTSAEGADHLEATAGRELILNCDQKATTWRHRGSNSTVTVVHLLPTGLLDCAAHWSAAEGGCREEITIDSTERRFIIFSPVETQDAGIYSCEADDFIQSFDVTVIQDSPPSLAFTLDASRPEDWNPNEVMIGETVQFECWVAFWGFKRPVLILSVYSDSDMIERRFASSHAEEAAQHGFYEEAQSTIIEKYTISQPKGRVEVRCRLEKLPHYQDDSSAQDFRVIYGPEFYETATNQTVDLVNGVAILNCSADSQPQASYAWFRVDALNRTELSATTRLYYAEAVGEYECEVLNKRTMNLLTKRFLLTASSPQEIVSPTTDKATDPVDLDQSDDTTPIWIVLIATFVPILVFISLPLWVYLGKRILKSRQSRRMLGGLRTELSPPSKAARYLERESIDHTKSQEKTTPLLPYQETDL